MFGPSPLMGMKNSKIVGTRFKKGSRKGKKKFSNAAKKCSSKERTGRKTFKSVEMSARKTGRKIEMPGKRNARTSVKEFRSAGVNERKTGRIVEKSEKIIVKARDNKVSTGNEVEIVMEKVALTWMTLASVEEGAGNPSGATNNSFIGLQTVC